MKKIVHITNDLQRLGGVQRLLIDLMTLQIKEFKFEVILTRGENEYQEELERLGVQVYHKRDLGLWGVVKRLNQADLVHAHLFPSLYIALLSSTPTVITEHNPHYRRRDLPLVKLMESILFRKFKKTACISLGVESALLRTLKWPSTKTEVICNGVDLSRFKFQVKELEKDKGVIKLGMVGRLHPQKDIKTLIDTIHALDTIFELHIAGDGELRKELENYAVSLGVQSRVHFYGQVNNIPEFLAGLDLYIQSSHWEGFGLAVVEAMAVGLPCFATDVEGLNDIVEKKCLFSVGDYQGLSNLIIELVANKDKYNSLSRLSLSTAKSYSIEASALNYKRLYEEYL